MVERSMVFNALDMIEKAAKADENWQAEANRLFGYSLGCQNNQDEVAAALKKINDILSLGGNVRIKVLDIPDDI